MRHLDEATLALLADHEPSAGEKEHLAACDECTRRVQAYRQQLGALRSLTDLEVPAVVDARVRAELTGVVPLQHHAVRRNSWRSLAQVAAAAVIFAFGAFVGSQRAQRQQVAAVPTRADSLRVMLDSAPDMTARVAALEAMVLTAEAALHDAPTDPFIRAHYLDVRRDRDLLRERVPMVSGDAQWY